jgi:demethoxyubiquinone hydroxylase (CLK1/Coq7/Cat5 family)
MTDVITAAPIIQEPEPESDFQCADCVLERRDVGHELLFILFLVIIFAAGAVCALYGGQTARSLTIACKSSLFLHLFERMNEWF